MDRNDGSAAQRAPENGLARRFELTIPAAVFLIGWLAIFIPQFKGLQMMPGDIGDARLNNYFLENIWRFMTGRSDSLWQLDFFYPFPWVGGFSDNLFGAAPAYLAARAAGAAPDTAFQIWFQIGYLANYVSAYCALRMLGVGKAGSAVGALVFTFALPTAANASHAQLQYRFGLPLTAAWFLRFLQSRRWEHLASAGAWLVWQFYCSIYLGFFGLLLIGPMTLLFAALELGPRRQSPATLSAGFALQWREDSWRSRAMLLTAFAGLALLLGVLFYPYLRVQHLYRATRSWTELAAMLPRLRSYLLSDVSVIWRPRGARLFDNLVMRLEHQMFFGLIPILLGGAGVVFGLRSAKRRTVALMTGALIAVVLLTLSVGPFSLWRLIYRVPPASAIRAVTRVDLALLLPLAYLAGVGLDGLLVRRRTRPLVAIAAVLLVAEFSLVTLPVSPKADWRASVAEKKNLIPAGLPRDAVLFFARTSPATYKDEIDAMWLAQERGLKTMNGYSGLNPPGEEPEYGLACSEALRRVMSYLRFSGQPTSGPAYRQVMDRIVPIGFYGCDPAWRTAPPPFTVSTTPYAKQEIGRLSYRLAGIEREDGHVLVRVTIVNSGPRAIAAVASTTAMIRLSWRFRDAKGEPLSGWNTRQDLPSDIPAGGSATMTVAVDPPAEARDGVLEMSLVQETLFWAHDAGVAPLVIPWT